MTMAQAFNPAVWLARFVQVGGGYALTDDRLLLWIVPGDLSDQALSDARVLVVELSRTQRAEVADHLRLLAMVEG